MNGAGEPLMNRVLKCGDRTHRLGLPTSGRGSLKIKHLHRIVVVQCVLEKGPELVCSLDTSAGTNQRLLLFFLYSVQVGVRI